MEFHKLPCDIVLTISFHLDTISRAQLSRTCTRIHDILKPELETAKQCRLAFPESASLCLPEVNWHREIKYWDKVRLHWLDNRYTEKTISLPDNVELYDIETYLHSNHLFVHMLNFGSLLIYDLSSYSEPEPVLETPVNVYVITASHMVVIESQTTEEFQLYRRDDFTRPRSFPLHPSLIYARSRSIKALNDNFIIFYYRSHMLIFDVRLARWESIFINNLHDKAPTIRFRNATSFKLKDAQTPDVWYIFKHDDQQWKYHGFIVDEPCLGPSNEEDIVASNSHVYLTISYDTKTPRLAGYEISSRRKIFEEKCTVSMNVLMNGKYLVMDSGCLTFQVRDFTNDLVQPHQYIADSAFVYQGNSD